MWLKLIKNSIKNHGHLLVFWVHIALDKYYMDLHAKKQHTKPTQSIYYYWPWQKGHDKTLLEVTLLNWSHALYCTRRLEGCRWSIGQPRTQYSILDLITTQYCDKINPQTLGDNTEGWAIIEKLVDNREVSRLIALTIASWLLGVKRGIAFVWKKEASHLSFYDRL